MKIHDDECLQQEALKRNERRCQAPGKGHVGEARAGVVKTQTHRSRTRKRQPRWCCAWRTDMEENKEELTQANPYSP